MEQVLTEDDVADMLDDAIDGNQTTWAEKHGISQPYVSDVLTARARPGKKILTALGLERVTRYQFIQPLRESKADE